MHEHATAEYPKLNLPADLLKEVNRRGATLKTDFCVEGWKPSLLRRCIEKFIGNRKR